MNVNDKARYTVCMKLILSARTCQSYAYNNIVHNVDSYDGGSVACRDNGFFAGWGTGAGDQLHAPITSGMCAHSNRVVF